MALSLLTPENSITVYQGESKTFLLTVEKPDPDNPGACLPVDLTGATLYFTVKKSANSTEIIFQKTSNDPLEIEISDPYSGIARIFLSPSDTSSLAPGSCYVFDVWVILASGKQHPVIKPSNFTVVKGVTVLP